MGSIQSWWALSVSCHNQPIFVIILDVRGVDGYFLPDMVNYAREYASLGGNTQAIRRWVRKTTQDYSQHQRVRRIGTYIIIPPLTQYIVHRSLFAWLVAGSSIMKRRIRLPREGV